MANYKEQAQEALDRYDALVAKHAEFENRSLSETEVAEERSLNAEIDSALAEVRDANASATREAEAAELRSKVAGLHVVTRSESNGSTSISEEIRSAVRSGAKTIDVSGGRAVSRTTEYRAAPVVGSAGGNYTNDQFVTAVMTAFAENTAIFRAGAKVFQTTSGESIAAPKVSNINSALTAQGAALPATADATNKTLNAYKYGAIVEVSRELVEDTGVDLAQLIADLAGDNVAGNVNADFMIGNGVNKPQGVVLGAGVGATAASATQVSVADLNALYFSVKDSARGKGVWFMNQATAAQVSALPGWYQSLDSSYGQLLGRPIFTDPNMDVAGAGKKSVVFGDPSKYLVRQVRGLRIETSADYLFGNDLVAIKVVWRGDGIVTDTNAIKVLTHP